VVGVLELKLNGEVGEDKPISLSSVRNRLAAESFNAIHIEIRSQGGCAASAFSIYNLLRAQPVPVAATAIGECHSGGLIIFMAASLRKAKAGAEFLLHPVSQSRDTLPERLTAQILQSHADALAKIDRRTVELFTNRTGYDKEWFEREIASEDALSSADAIQTGIVHEFRTLTPPCDPTWPDTAHRIAKEARNVYLPRHMTSQNYFDACRCAVFFEPNKEAEKVESDCGVEAPRYAVTQS
jgi:ATP-dependent protease ClpP protease subunit